MVQLPVVSVRWRRERRGRQLSCVVQTPLVVSPDLEVAGFGSEEQRRWRQVAVKRRRRETVFGGGEADFEVVFDSSGAEEECVSAVGAV